MVMEQRSHSLMILVCVWCVLTAAGLVTVVNAQTSKMDVSPTSGVEPSLTCSPDGPITVDTGTELTMQCTSKNGNTSITTDGNVGDIFKSVLGGNDGKGTRSLDIIVTPAYDNVKFVCDIPSMSCTIGPITVRQDTSTKEQNTSKPSSPDIALILGAMNTAVIALMILLLVVTIFLVWICRNREPKQSPRVAAPKADMPADRRETRGYTELQGLDVMTRNSMGLVPEDTHDQCQCQPREGLQDERSANSYTEVQPTVTKTTESKGHPHAYCNTILCEEGGRDIKIKDKNLPFEMIGTPRNKNKQYENMPTM